MGIDIIHISGNHKFSNGDCTIAVCWYVVVEDWIIWWNLLDCWPQISPAYIAYPFSPKPSLAAVRDAYGRIPR